MDSEAHAPNHRAVRLRIGSKPPPAMRSYPFSVPATPLNPTPSPENFDTILRRSCSSMDWSSKRFAMSCSTESRTCGHLSMAYFTTCDLTFLARSERAGFSSSITTTLFRLFSLTVTWSLATGSRNSFITRSNRRNRSMLGTFLHP